MSCKTKLKYKHQIVVYTELINELEKSLKAFEKMDGKVINVRLENALIENSNNKNINISLGNRINGLKKVTFYNYNRSISLKDGTTYVDYSDIEILIQERPEFKRVNYEQIKKIVLDRIIHLKEQILEIENNLTNFDNMIKEYKEINDMIAKFKNKYYYNIRVDSGCDNFLGY